MKDADARTFVIKAVTELFVDRDVTALDRHWSQQYVQHNPQFADGTDGLRGLVGSGLDFTYEIGLAVATDDVVMVHGRYTGLAEKPVIAVDIFRVADGLIAEHWDVLQDEVTQTASGRPMFDPAE